MVLDDIERSRLAWWALGFALFAAVAFVVYSFIGTFVFGAFIYYATRPIYARIRRRIGSPTVAAAVSLFALVLPALLLVGYAVVIVAKQVNNLTTVPIDLTAYPAINSFLATYADPERVYQAALALDLRELVTPGSVGSLLSSIADVADILAVVGVALLHLFVMVAFAFYLLRDGHKLGRWARLRFADEDGVVEAYLTAVDGDLNSIFFGNILNAVITGTIGVIAYSALNTGAPQSGGIPAAALVGLLAGVASLIPIVGMKLVYVPVALFLGVRAVVFTGVSDLWFVVVFVAVSFVVVDTIPDLVLRPYVSGRSLHVGSVMLAYTLGPLLFGWFGIFLMPMLLVLVVHFARIVLPELLAGHRIRPYVVDPTYLSDDYASPSSEPSEPAPEVQQSRVSRDSVD
jgi:predicted PurR-regulated permease PerM